MKSPLMMVLFASLLLSAIGCVRESTPIEKELPKPPAATRVEEPPTPKRPKLPDQKPIVVSLPVLVETYENELAGDRKYKGKWLEVEGVINGPKVDLVVNESGHDEDALTAKLADGVMPLSEPELHLVERGFKSIECRFGRSAEESLRNEFDSEKVAVVGRCIGKWSPSPVLVDCSVVKSFRDDRLANEKRQRLENEQLVRTAAPRRFTDPNPLGGDSRGSVGYAVEGLSLIRGGRSDPLVGKVVEVTGTVEEVNNEKRCMDGGWSPTPEERVLAIVFKGAIGLDCFFLPKHEEALSRIRRGQTVTIRGMVEVNRVGSHRGFLKLCVLSE